MELQSKKQFTKLEIKKFITIITIIANIGLLQAQYTAIPDTNFEQELINQGIDSENTLDGQVLTSDINTLVSLDLLGLIHGGIEDLTGIEDFIALESLYTEYQLFTSLDLSNNINLKTLVCDYCENLTNLNISQNSNLEILFVQFCNLNNINISQNNKLRKFYCKSNQLTIIDISQNSLLTSLNCTNNFLTNLDLSQNTNLKFLSCGSNQLSSLDLNQNLNLEVLSFRSNQIPNLDLSQHSSLIWVWGQDNQLVSLDLRNDNNLNFTEFSSIGNPNLSCIYVDNSEFSSNNWLNIDVSSTFIETELECESLVIEEQIINNYFATYPNPVKNNLYIISNTNNIKTITVFDILGKEISRSNKNEIDFSSQKNGIYFLKIMTNRGLVFYKKIIKIGA